ncbi:MAG: flavodoxin-dependent (E)-4-hydroxy-3-methylbut-2-enyl-diphosphate synthase [Tissierellia bacterium]|nr:flavodoxin-dependent (E)-4-hydroxy-3-methylbut-2-enyl-diphosphate synthase [Tissierellia bacterium]
MKVERKKIYVGDVAIGGNAPVTVQTMTNTITSDVESTVQQILLCEKYGLDLVRAAVNNEEDAKAIKEIKKRIHVPFIADIQYDYRLAMWAVENGADCIRINPGNMNSKNGLKELVKALSEKNIPIRVGVNSGSISREIIDRFHGVNVDSLVASAIEEVETLEDLNFTNMKVAIKSSDIYTSVAAYRKFYMLKEYPLHLGITEAGPYEQGSIKSAIGLGILLAEGIGNTIRVSLTDDPYKEVIAGKLILSSLNLHGKGINLISCPTCARTNGEMIALVQEFLKRKPEIQSKLNIAIMGCHVNGPGEAREADLGLAMTKQGAHLFRKGKKIQSCSREEAVDILIDAIIKLDGEKSGN